MSRRGINSSLEDQMARLHDSISGREKRRLQQQDMRQSGQDDPYEDRANKRVAGGRPGIETQPYNASAAALAAVASASALEGPRLLHCDLCSVSFAKDAQMQQHLTGPTHKKALEKHRAEEQRLQQLGNNRWAAENAAGAAAWQQRDVKYTAAQRQPLPPKDPDASPTEKDRLAAGPAKAQTASQQKQTPRLAPAQAAATSVQRVQTSHAQLVAAAAAANEGPLSINGWVPPSVSLVAAAVAPEAASSEISEPPPVPADEAAAQQGQHNAGSPEQRSGSAENAAGGLVGYGSDSASDDSSSSSDAEQRGSGDGVPRSFF